MQELKKEAYATARRVEVVKKADDCYEVTPLMWTSYGWSQNVRYRYVATQAEVYRRIYLRDELSHAALEGGFTIETLEVM